MTALLVLVGVFGLVVGSFLNVVIYRVPRQLSVVRPRSSCPQCHAFIAERDNIPVLSWVLLRGRCRHCRNPISVRYPLVELGTGLLFALTAWRVGAHADLAAFLVLDAALVALALIDFEMLILPRTIIFMALGLVAACLVTAAAVDHQWHRLGVAALWSIGWFVVFYVMNFLSPRSLGFGDVRLSLLLGLSLGWLGTGVLLIGFFAANLTGAVVGITLIAAKKRTRDEPIPYGVYLALGALFAVLFGPALMSHWHYWPNAA